MSRCSDRIIAVVLVFALAVFLLPVGDVQASANNFTYLIVDEEIVITGGMPIDGVLAIPDMIDGYPVRHIGDYAFENGTTIHEVLIPDGVRRIGNGAFMSCKWINRIIIPASVTGIGANAFADCTYLHSIRFDGSSPQIENNAFSNVIASACYSHGSGWPDHAKQNYGGIITWIGGHDYGSYAYGVGATCTEDGVIQQVCQRCGILKQSPDIGSKLGHSFGAYVSDGNATCMCDGTKTATCDRCDAHNTVVDVGSRAHKDHNADCLCDFCFEIMEHDCIDEDNSYRCDLCYDEYCNAGECFPGDISGDGKVNMGDLVKLYAHHKRTSILPDETVLGRCDITGDGKVNMGDVSKLYAHIKGISKLY